ncbi:MAG: DNA translocase FtsK [Clostridia bacterium]|nr:DNA translocase FtsK [Clostridia bacterium]
MAEGKKGPGRPKKSTASKTPTKAELKAKEIQEKNKRDKRVVDEIWAIIIIALGCFLAVSVFTTGAGKLGEFFGRSLKGLFGYIGYVAPVYFIVFGILLIAKQTTHFSFKTFFLLFAMLLMICTAWSIRFIEATRLYTITDTSLLFKEGVELQSGGLFGMLIASALMDWIGKWGCLIFVIVVCLICLLLIMNSPISRFFTMIHDKLEKRKLIKQNAHLDENDNDTVNEQQSMFVPGTRQELKIVNHLDGTDTVKPPMESAKELVIEPLTEQKKNNILKFMNDDSIFGRSNKSDTKGLDEKRESKAGFGMSDDNQTEVSADEHVETGLQEPVKIPRKRQEVLPVEPMKEIPKAEDEKPYRLPPVSLLDKPKKGSSMSNSILMDNAKKLEDTLKSFNVDATVVQVTQGPTVTRYELKPSVGVKVSNIENLADDIALSLAAKSIRIEAPIPGKSVVGIEIDNTITNTVTLREVLDSNEFRNAPGKLTMGLGKDIAGTPIVADLKSLTHLLIAGSTGSGKSVCINTIISSLMFKATPDELRFILIDPKRGVELGKYNGIPYLKTPVVTDAKGAVSALNWAVAEMMNRYENFAHVGAKDFNSYNDKMRAMGEPDRVIPNIVIIIDELADLMSVSKAQIEEAIQRLTQLARAAGMHVILATQRPSVNVITGVIKANVPSKIAFAVSNQTDSRVIIDMNGAEKLIGKGDMLYCPIGISKPIRVQGAFISDDEVYRVIEYAKQQALDEPDNLEPLTVSSSQSSFDGGEGGDDDEEYLAEAISYVVQAKKASTSMLQRRFRIGYNRAARIMDIMEEKGIIGPADGSRSRQVLLTNEELGDIEDNE